MAAADSSSGNDAETSGPLVDVLERLGPRRHRRGRADGRAGGSAGRRARESRRHAPRRGSRPDRADDAPLARRGASLQRARGGRARGSLPSVRPGLALGLRRAPAPRGPARASPPPGRRRSGADPRRPPGERAQTSRLAGRLFRPLSTRCHGRGRDRIRREPDRPRGLCRSTSLCVAAVCLRAPAAYGCDEARAELKDNIQSSQEARKPLRRERQLDAGSSLWRSRTKELD